MPEHPGQELFGLDAGSASRAGPALSRIHRLREKGRPWRATRATRPEHGNRVGIDVRARSTAARNSKHDSRAGATTDTPAVRPARPKSGHARAAAVVTGAAIVALVATSAATRDNVEAQRSANDAAIAARQARLAAAEAAPETAGLQARLRKLSRAAATDAAKVRDAQQAYAPLYYDASRQPTAENGTPNTAMLLTAEHRKALAPLFDPKSSVVDDRDAYSWHNVLPFDEDTRIDPRFAWYVRYDGEDASPPAATRGRSRR